VGWLVRTWRRKTDLIAARRLGFVERNVSAFQHSLEGFIGLGNGESDTDGNHKHSAVIVRKTVIFHHSTKFFRDGSGRCCIGTWTQKNKFLPAPAPYVISATHIF